MTYLLDDIIEYNQSKETNVYFYSDNGIYEMKNNNLFKFAIRMICKTILQTK